MSRYVFNPSTKEMDYTTPTSVEIPPSAFKLTSSTVVVEPAARTSPFLIAIVVTLIVLLLIFVIYFLWLLFIKTDAQTPASFFSWITGN